ncbi:glycoside hydrolase family 65 protein [Thermoflavifilum thermophilum]|uniref:hypothetical protein n=1 Tax=Thermoflavifilum thermophilum TaxID=1393122 RepID=UPI001C9E70D8|nr:hypothetical protein [Thermoflavifilum thermophilum]
MQRHNIRIQSFDSLGSLTVGNGQFAFTVDITGLQSFPDAYLHGVPLGTLSDWGWHSFPNDSNYTIEEATRWLPSCQNRLIPYALQFDTGRAARAANYLRANPQRIHLGLFGLHFYDSSHHRINLSQIKNVDETLDMWSGQITSRFTVQSKPVKVTTYCHQQKDLIATQVITPLWHTHQAELYLYLPYPSAQAVSPGYDTGHVQDYITQVIHQSNCELILKEQIDTTIYYVYLKTEQPAHFVSQQAHLWRIIPTSNTTDTFRCSVWFTPKLFDTYVPDFAETAMSSRQGWADYWNKGGYIDFSHCTDPRAFELERRMITSLYLTRAQCAGVYPPQETGLTYNSWYGKFHLEMYGWHILHFALWGHPEIVERSLQWFAKVLPEARHTAAIQGFKGVRWQKMTDPSGRRSPSSVGELLIWQQPNVIFLADMLYRITHDARILHQYQNLVFETADFMASFAHLDSTDHLYHLCHPLIPAQEIFHAEQTDDPAFELNEWYVGLQIAQQWRKRLHLSPNPYWQDVMDHLAPLPVKDSLYLPEAHATEAYTQDTFRRDHPIVLGILGMLPWTKKVNLPIMNHTFDEVMKKWNWKTTWGWDFPMMAMTATRLGRPEDAIRALLMPVQKNTYLINGHNYQDQRLRVYLPGNGGLLTALAFMAAGYDGATTTCPGFPHNGKWNIRWSGLYRLW